jgi:hypothetical protein
MTTKARAVRRCAVLLNVLACVLAVGIALCGNVLADDGPQIATATTQDLLEPVPGLSVVWHNRRVSALPFRIRLLDQASPLAYSLDIRRPAAYGDSWTGISLGRPAHQEDRSLASIGVANPLIAEAIARGDAPSGNPAVPAINNLDLAARQVAIWAATNNIALTPRAVPNAGLRRRAKKLLADVNGIQVPLQSASHSVQIFVQDTTANTVQLAVTIGLDANTHSTTAQNIDLYLDGVRCPIRTQAQTHIEQRSDGTYHADKPKPFAPKTHSTDVAEVDLDRNTKVVDATAVWVNVISEPGLVMAGAGAAPPLVTAEAASLNFTSTTRLDPSDYTNPEQLLNNAATAFLTTLHGWAVWAVLLIALYLLPRVGRLVDTGLSAGYRLARPKAKSAPEATVNPATVEVEAATESEAIRAGLSALNLSTSNDVNIKILQPSKHSLLGTNTPARVRLTRRPGQDS